MNHRSPLPFTLWLQNYCVPPPLREVIYEVSLKNFYYLKFDCPYPGLILVTDSNNQCVQCFGGQVGECRLRFGVRGRSPGQMQRPAGIAVLHNGNFAMADYDNKCVSIFEPSGKFVNRVGAGKLLGK